MPVEIVAEGISVTLGGRRVLRDASFRIRPRERTAIVGPNGGGKTTLGRVLLGLLEPDAGRISFLDETGAEVPRPRFGYLPQRSTLTADAPVSGLDLVMLGLAPKAGLLVPAPVKEMARVALERAGLSPELIALPVGRLSGGQRQRVILARALASSPDVLLLDEPDTALDSEGMARLRRIVSEEVAAGRTVVYITHDAGAMGGADAVFRVDGTVVEEGLA